jgi:hypothetical protein
MLEVGTLIRRKETANFYPGILAEIISFQNNRGGTMYEVRILEGRQAALLDNWDSRNFNVELPREPDWEV